MLNTQIYEWLYSLEQLTYFVKKFYAYIKSTQMYT